MSRIPPFLLAATALFVSAEDGLALEYFRKTPVPYRHARPGVDGRAVSALLDTSKAVVVFGAGKMGVPIGYALSSAHAILEGQGRSVIFVEREEAARKQIEQRIRAIHTDWRRHGISTESIDDVLARVSWAASISEIAQPDNVGLVLEAASERLDIKREIYAQLVTCIPGGTIIGTNTSSLNLYDLADRLPDSHKTGFMLWHYSNRPDAVRFVEVAPLGQTLEGNIDAAVSYLRHRLLYDPVKMHRFSDGAIFNVMQNTLNWIAARKVDSLLRRSVDEQEAVAMVDLAANTAGRHIWLPHELQDSVDMLQTQSGQLETQIGPEAFRVTRELVGALHQRAQWLVEQGVVSKLEMLEGVAKVLGHRYETLGGILRVHDFGSQASPKGSDYPSLFSQILANLAPTLGFEGEAPDYFARLGHQGRFGVSTLHGAYEYTQPQVEALAAAITDVFLGETALKFAAATAR